MDLTITQVYKWRNRTHDWRISKRKNAWFSLWKKQALVYVDTFQKHNPTIPNDKKYGLAVLEDVKWKNLDDYRIFEQVSLQHESTFGNIKWAIQRGLWMALQRAWVTWLEMHQLDSKSFLQNKSRYIYTRSV